MSLEALKTFLQIPKTNCIVEVLRRAEAADSAAAHVPVEIAHASSRFSRLGFRRLHWNGNLDDFPRAVVVR
jgi:hypothetical protein